jgi:hypothetical protein
VYGDPRGPTGPEDQHWNAATHCAEGHMMTTLKKLFIIAVFLGTFTIVCDRVHAHNDYDARLFANAIAFGEYKPQSPGEPMNAAYDNKRRHFSKSRICRRVRRHESTSNGL